MRIVRAMFDNLFSIGHVEIILSKRGLVLVTGESLDEGGANGSGKSSISSKGIVWTLFGTTSGGLRAGNVVNRHGGKAALGEVEFVDSGAVTWLVRRSRPAKLELYRDGMLVSSKETKETQASIDVAIGMNLATFVQTCHFGQGRAMSYAGLTAKDQKALLEQILPMEEIDEWTRYSGAMGKLLKTQKETSASLEIQCHATVNERRLALTLLKSDSEAWKRTHLEKLTDLKHQKNVAENGMADQSERLQWTKDQLDEIDTDTLAAEQIVLEDSVRAAEEAHVAVMMTLRGAQDVHSKWDKKEYTLEDEIHDLKKSITCPTCERSYGPEQESLIADKITTLEFERAAAIQNMCEARDAKEWYVTAVEEASLIAVRIGEELGAVTAKLEEAVRWTHLIDQIDREIRDAITPLKIRIEEAEKETDPYSGLQMTSEAKLEEAEESWKTAQGTMKHINEEITHVQYWEKVYGKDLKLKMFEECCGFLDGATARHLKGLRNEQFKVKFSTIKRMANGDTKDEFAVTVESDTGGGNFDSLSGGEQQMVSFAIGLALADLASCKTASKPEFLILDEPFSELDERNSEAIVDYLTGDFGKTKDTLLLISNEASLQGLIPERIHVVKQGGISNVSSD